ncbi:Hypothetical predicted protein [Paramuricea clavata]|uniref:Uncharacterized protein n=1 Tax=Paramuricea clavata TaxID=317549 RepID=A0A6S7GB92_PARCT|nr:Hypothetical predicted protein [Paramuricea clavata]
MKHRKIDPAERTNRKRVICLRCDKVLNADNTTYHQQSIHKGLTPKFQDIVEKSQRLLNFESFKPVELLSESIGSCQQPTKCETSLQQLQTQSRSRESTSYDASWAPVQKEVDVEIEIDQSSLPDADVHQNISSDSATAENEKQQTICSQASVIVSESIFEGSETAETDVNDRECRKIDLVRTETELPPLPNSTATIPELMLEDTENTLENADNEFREII